MCVCVCVCLSVCLSFCIYMLHIRYVAGLQAVEHMDANTVLENVDVTSLVKNHWDYRDKLHVLLQVVYSLSLSLSHTHTLSLSLSLTHTHTHKQEYTHTHIGTQAHAHAVPMRVQSISNWRLKHYASQTKQLTD